MEVNILTIEKTIQYETSLEILGVYDNDNIDNAETIARQKYPKDASSIGVYTIDLNDLSTIGKGDD